MRRCAKALMPSTMGLDRIPEDLAATECIRLVLRAHSATVGRPARVATIFVQECRNLRVVHTGGDPEPSGAATMYCIRRPLLQLAVSPRLPLPTSTQSVARVLFLSGGELVYTWLRPGADTDDLLIASTRAPLVDGMRGYLTPA